MKQQGVTGQSTEQKVRSLLKAVGLEAEKPIPDNGVDLRVWHPGKFSLIKTAILPFRGQIIFDGLFEKNNILIGPNMMKELKEEIKEKRKNNEIIKEI